MRGSARAVRILLVAESAEGADRALLSPLNLVLLLALSGLTALACAPTETGNSRSSSETADAAPDSAVSVCVHLTTEDPSRKDTDTLPSGACGTAESCDLIVREQCRCPYGGWPRTFFRCDCTGAKWHCEVISADTSVCPPPGLPGCAVANGGAD